MKTTDTIRIEASSGPINRDVISKVVERSGTDIRRCFHCQSCGGGCPVSQAMTYRPNGVIRLLQLPAAAQAGPVPSANRPRSAPQL
jgi:heterodisulfide reductase subunit C